MKIINLLSLVQAKNDLENENSEKFLTHYDIEIRDNEIEDLWKLIETLIEKDKKIRIGQ